MTERRCATAAGLEEMAHVRERIRDIAGHSLKGTETGDVLDAVLDSPGKMLRPRLLLLCSGFGAKRKERLEQLFTLGAMVELTHMASLIHDDIVDDGRFRHGRVSIQRRFGKDAAVYAGDFLIARVNYRMAKEDLREGAMILSETISEMCVGEIGQDVWRFCEDLTAEQYIKNISGKTASLFSASCVLGALYSTCPKETAERLGRLGKHIGIMFQLRDDLLDFTSQSPDWGKETHRDFLEGIYTLPLIRALELPEARKLLLPLLRENRNSPLGRDGLRQVEELIREFGGIDAAKLEIHHYADECFSLLDTLETGVPKEQIGALIEKLDTL